MKTEGNIKGVLLEFLKFAEYQVENDRCSLEQMKSLCEVIMRDIKVMATIDDIAGFYGQSSSNVRNVLARRIIPKGDKERRVMYNFARFIRMMPEKWLKRNNEHTDNHTFCAIVLHNGAYFLPSIPL